MKNIYLIVFFVLNYCVFPVQAEDDFKLVDSNDKRMNHAFKKAKSTLKGFLKLVDKGRNKNSIYGAYIKYEDKGETEYVWVTDVQKYDKEYYIGYVISEPRLVKNVKKGQTVGYRVSDIYDWQHYDKKNKITYGAYTTCALIDPSSQEDKDYAKEIGLQCSP